MTGAYFTRGGPSCTQTCRGQGYGIRVLSIDDSVGRLSQASYKAMRAEGNRAQGQDISAK